MRVRGVAEIVEFDYRYGLWKKWYFNCWLVWPGMRYGSKLIHNRANFWHEIVLCV